MNYILKIISKLWRGELSLAKSYWFFGNIVPLLFLIVILIANITLHENPSAILLSNQLLPKNIFSKIIILPLYILFMIYILISVVGIWRSSNKFQGRKIWGNLSKIAIIFSSLIFLKDFFKYFF